MRLRVSFARYRLLLGLAPAVFALDQITKLWIAEVMPPNTFGPPGHIEIVPDFFNLVRVGNTGAAWSILSGRSTWLAFLALVALRKRDFVALAKNMQLAKNLPPKQREDFKKACAAFQFHDPARRESSPAGNAGQTDNLQYSETPWGCAAGPDRPAPHRG